MAIRDKFYQRIRKVLVKHGVLDEAKAEEAAGIADGPDLMKINFIGHRHLIDRLIQNNQLPSGSAICFISSVVMPGARQNSLVSSG